MRARFIVAAIAAITLTGLTAPVARADRLPTPGDCPGIATVSGGYRLTTDVTCDFNWPGSNQVLNLNHHTLTGVLLPSGTGQTIKNGTLLVPTQEYLANATNFTISKVKVVASAGVTGFMVEAGTGLTVTNSRFSGAPIGLGFFFGGNGTVKNTTFTGNDYGMTIQKGSNVTVESNTFTGNGIGLQLLNEDGYGVNNNVVKKNKFTSNSTFGLAVRLRALPRADTGEGNLISGNTITGSGGSAVYFQVLCQPGDSGQPALCPGAGNTLRGNTLKNNGLTPDAAWPGADDGVTARGELFTGTTPFPPYPAALAGLTVTKNSANRNADLGFDVTGVVDGGGNTARHNGNPAQCQGVTCEVALARVAAARPLPALTATIPAILRHS